MANCIREGNDGILIDVVVAPNSTVDQISYVNHQSRIKVRVRAKAEKENANNHVMKMFSKLFGDCSIVSGHHSKKKTLVVGGTNLNLDEVIKKLVYGG